MQVPSPLQIKQRRRMAIRWILDAAEKRKDVKLSDRIAKEIINVAEGKSGAWERRNMLHKQGITARANVRHGAVKRVTRSVRF